MLVDVLIDDADRRFRENAQGGREPTSNLSGPSSFTARNASFSHASQHIADAALDERCRRAARAGVEYRHVVVELLDEGLGAGVRCRRAASEPRPTRRGSSSGRRPMFSDWGVITEIPGRTKSPPIVDAFRIALAHQEHDGRSIWECCCSAIVPASSPAAGRPGTRWSRCRRPAPRVTTSASSPSITERACLPEPPWLWLTVTVSPLLVFQYAANALL